MRITADGVTCYGQAEPTDVAEIAHLLGGSFDLDGFVLAHPDVAARSPGFRPPLLADPFEMLVTAVTAQQISLRAAAMMRAGLVRRFGTAVSHDGVEWWRFPTRQPSAAAISPGSSCPA